MIGFQYEMYLNNDSRIEIKTVSKWKYCTYAFQQLMCNAMENHFHINATIVSQHLITEISQNAFSLKI